MTTAAEIMSARLLTFQEQMTVEQAIQQLVSQGFSAAPVVRGQQMVGIVSELELFDVLFDPSLREMPLSEFMVEEVVTVDEATPLNRIAHLFALHGIRRVPVTRDGVPVGVVSRRDLLKYASTNEEALIDPLCELVPDLHDVCVNNSG